LYGLNDVRGEQLFVKIKVDNNHHKMTAVNNNIPTKPTNIITLSLDTVVLLVLCVFFINAISLAYLSGSFATMNGSGSINNNDPTKLLSGKFIFKGPAFTTSLRPGKENQEKDKLMNHIFKHKTKSPLEKSPNDNNNNNDAKPRLPIPPPPPPDDNDDVHHKYDDTNNKQSESSSFFSSSLLFGGSSSKPSAETNNIEESPWNVETSCSPDIWISSSSSKDGVFCPQDPSKSIPVPFSSNPHYKKNINNNNNNKKSLSDIYKSVHGMLVPSQDKPVIWLERNKDTGKILFKFHQLWHKPNFKELALFDPDRGIVLVLTRFYAFIGVANSYEEAKTVALEVDKVHTTGSWRSDKGAKKIKPRLHGESAETAKVIVLISQFRDQLCANTLRELFDHAYNKKRVTVGVVSQGDAGDPNCLEDYCKLLSDPSSCPRNQIKQIVRPLPHSRGVMPARYLQQTLITDEEFCLQIDSHMVFPDNWDLVAITDWLGADNEMAVMTTYPNRAVDRNDQEHSPARCNTVWGHNVVACGTSAANIRHHGDPILVAFFGAGIAFNKCHANKVVPYDPYMPFLFKGEEYDRSARLWTHGYDLYAPRKNYAYHFYDDDPRPKGFDNKPRDRSFLNGNREVDVLLVQSEMRWQAVFGMLSPPPPTNGQDDSRLQRLQKAHNKALELSTAAAQDVDLFGLGTRRSLREYLMFSGISLLKHTTQDLCDKLGKMPWIPWDIPDNFEPLGYQCNFDMESTCPCYSTLSQGLRNADEHLKLTNHELFDQYKKSSPIAQEVISEPILSLGWWAAENKCDKG
jgi:hypothetical protein